ncbi:uncharacterized protein CLUP02_03080 [Colletotrichum lupini]|uniref:Uncharacterized protein n=1 Tax=Colletotrichum lupini TaxID=145971 RepID=A0A9Q8SHT4_9PEZI|nr:uncharacterized protein CLUP02_03080 [Colletotrichum lupini]UQC77611.1 hypothetical protein CLUP02_03080 [Colletotrichum lupini]
MSQLNTSSLRNLRARCFRSTYRHSSVPSLQRVVHFAQPQLARSPTLEAKSRSPATMPV